MCEFLLQCLKPVLLRGSPRFRWADSSHSYRWVVTDFCHNLIYWCLEDRNIYFPLSFHRSCPALYPDVMKWWSVLCISWQHSTTATSMNHEYMTIMLQSLHYFCRIAERGCVHFIFNESPQLLCNDSLIVSNLPHIREVVVNGLTWVFAIANEAWAGSQAVFCSVMVKQNVLNYLSSKLQGCNKNHRILWCPFPGRVQILWDL